MVARQARGRTPIAHLQSNVGLVVRVSTDMQASNPEGSLTNQVQRLRQHLQYKTEVAEEDWREVALYELKGISGKDTKWAK